MLHFVTKGDQDFAIKHSEAKDEYLLESVYILRDILYIFQEKTFIFPVLVSV